MSFDHIIRSDIRISQPDKGFRFGVDSCILAWFASVKRKDAVLEIGAGSGVISVLLAKLKGVKKIVSVELQESLYGHLLKSIEANGLQQAIAPVHADIRLYKPNLPLDFIITNPPYRKRGTGFINADISKRSARFDGDMSLEDVFIFAGRYLRFGGKLAFSGVADRLADSIFLSRKHGMEPKHLQILYSSPRKKGKLFFLESVYGGREGLQIAPPLWAAELNDCDSDSPYNLIMRGDWNV
ncbi:MAG: methyltransferase [Deferribacteraceae bacterium]|jgi:tRNA1Val (adenine37-N6)-methyltransferase|nr:methyltransferase [Deferribacteraceae bacterium]